MLQRHGWWRALHPWQQVIVVGALLVVLAIATGLIYFRPGATAAPTSASPASRAMPTPGPLYPPGTDEYYYWGQNKSLDQQP